MRWTSSATSSENVSPRRERFSPLNVVLGTFSAFILLLALLYPEERLLEILDTSRDGNAATVRYLEALLRVHPNDVSLRIRLAGEVRRVGFSRKALDLLASFPIRLSPAEQHTVLVLRYRILKELLLATKTGDVKLQNYQAEFADTARKLAQGKPTVWDLRRFAADAKETGDLETHHAFSRQADVLAASMAPVPIAGVPGDPFALALAGGDYRTAAGICFNNMKQANGNNLKRELFIKGVRTLQSGNLPVEAFEAGERHLNGLADDRETLVFLTKVGLAAGKPERAQRLIKRALKMSEKSAHLDIS
ncbi:MAG: hypothetical protein A2X79_03035 [Desulfuromonadaceae bacterium GWB2_53_15]|nr:MAG: hypothetical protein A2X79_03035 [Desulfuromonadaceae bacterium GWB2_53_15]